MTYDTLTVRHGQKNGLFFYSNSILFKEIKMAGALKWSLIFIC
jgi:hypothetical protein